MKRLFKLVQLEVVKSTATTSGTGNDDRPDFYVREVEGVLKIFHFRVQLFFIFGIINAALYEIVQVDFSKALSDASLLTFIPKRRRKIQDKPEANLEMG